MYWDEDDEYVSGVYPRNPRKVAAIRNGTHFVNKNEGKVLRKLKQKTGMTEAELRLDPTHRKSLSVAQDKGEKSNVSKKEKVEKKLMKRVTRELKLAKEHPKCQEMYKTLLADYKKRNPLSWYYGV